MIHEEYGYTYVICHILKQEYTYIHTVIVPRENAWKLFPEFKHKSYIGDLGTFGSNRNIDHVALIPSS